MLQYVDGFSCSLNQESNSLVIKFTQKEPVIEDNGNVEEIVNPVASIVMEKSSAIALFSAIQNMYKDVTPPQLDQENPKFSRIDSKPGK